MSARSGETCVSVRIVAELGNSKRIFAYEITQIALPTTHPPKQVESRQLIVTPGRKSCLAPEAAGQNRPAEGAVQPIPPGRRDQQQALRLRLDAIVQDAVAVEFLGPQ